MPAAPRTRARSVRRATPEPVQKRAAAYLETQVQLAYAARDAHDAVTELHTSWLTTPPEEAVIEARPEQPTRRRVRNRFNDAVTMILGALRSNGYGPVLRIEDIEYFGGGPFPAWTPGEDS